MAAYWLSLEKDENLNDVCPFVVSNAIPRMYIEFYTPWLY